MQKTIYRAFTESAHRCRTSLFTKQSSGMGTFMLIAALWLSGGSAAWAATYYWDNNGTTAGFGTAGGTWAAPTVSQWSTDLTGVAAPGASVTTTTGDPLYFGTDAAGLGSGTITVSGTQNAQHLYFGKASGAITLSGGTIGFINSGATANIKAASGGGSAGATHTINSNVQKTGGSISIGRQNTSGENYIFNGIISGTAGLDLRPVNNGAYVVLNGTNTFSGNVGLVTGQLNVNSVANSGVACSLGAGTTFSMAGGGGQNPTFWYTGTSAGSMNRTINLNGGGDRIVSQDAPLTLSGNVTGTSGGFESGVVLSGDAGGGSDFNEISGVFGGNARVSVEAETPLGGSSDEGVWKLSGNNTYDGTTTVNNNSTLIVAHNNALGLTSSSTTVSGNGQLLLEGGIAIGAEALSLNSGQTASWNGQTGAALRNYAGNNSWAGAITLTTAATIAVNPGTTLTINKTAGTVLLTKSGSGTLTHAIANAGDLASGGTIIEGGTLEWLVTSSGIESIPGSSTVISNGATLVLQDTGSDNRMAFAGDTVTFGSNGGGTIDFAQGNFLMQGGTDTFEATGGSKNVITSSVGTAFFNLQGANTVLFDVADGSDDVDLEMGVTINNGFLSKSGAGTLSMVNSQNDLNKNVTISAGTLEIAEAGRLQSGNYSQTIANNAALVYSSSAAQTLSGVISGSGSLRKETDGSTLTLSAANTYFGTTTVNGGTLDLVGQNRIGTAVVVDGSGVAKLSGTSHNAMNSINPITLQNGGTFTDDTTGTYVQSVNAPVTFSNGGTMTSEAGANGFGGFGNFLFINGINVTGTGLATISANGMSYNFAQTVTVADSVAGSGTDLLISSSIKNDRVGLITKAGAGTLTMTGVNVDTSPFAITGGTLEIGGAGQLNSGTYAGAVANDGAFVYNSSAAQTMSGVISGTGTLTKDNTGTLSLSGANTYSGATAIDGGTLQLGTGGTVGSLNTASAISVASGATFAVNQTDTVTQGTDFSGAAISGAGGVANNGSGTLVLNVANTYAGPTATSTGIIQVNHSTALGATAGATDVSGGKLHLDGSGGDLTIAEDITVGATSGGGGIRNLSGDNTISGLVTLSSSTDLRRNAGSLTFSGGITASNHGVSFNGLFHLTNTPVNLGSGGATFTSNGNNPASDSQIDVGGNIWGTTLINFGGYVTLGVNDALPTDTDLTFGWTSAGQSSGTLDLNGNDQEVASIETRSTTLGDGGDHKVTGGGTLTVNQTSGTEEFQGRITDGSGTATLVKLGAGTLILNNLSGTASDYSGLTTINGGVLQMGDINALGSTAQGTVVNSGGALDIGGLNPPETSITLSGSGADGVGGNGALFNSGANLQLNGTDFTLNSATEIGGGSQIAFISGTPSNVDGNNNDLTILGNVYNWQAIFTDIGLLTINTNAFLGLNGATIANNATSVRVADNAIAFTWGSGHDFTSDWTFEEGAQLQTYWNGGGAGSSSAEISGNVTLNGDITFTGQANQPAQTSTQTLSGNVGGTGGITKTGQAASTLILSGTSSYSGDTTISLGTFLAGAAGALSPNSAVSLAAGTVMEMDGFDNSVGSLAGAGTVENANATAATLTAGGDDSTTSFSGVLQDGTGSSLGLTKDGTGTMTLSAASTFSGDTTVNDGVLELATGASLNTAITVRIAGSAQMDLGAGINQTVAGLWLNGAEKWAGTWGATGSSASNIDDTYFSGTGILTVTAGSLHPASVFLFN